MYVDLYSDLSIGDVEFNITGIIQANSDPLNMHLENILVDTYSLTEGWKMYISCNYPEAFLNGEFKINNLTAVTSSDRIGKGS